MTTTATALSPAAPKIETLTTGSEGLNAALGIGGYPLGRVVQVSGRDGSELDACLQAIAANQANGLTCAFVDCAGRLDPVRAMELGVNVELLLVAQPDDAQGAIEVVRALTKSRAVELIVVDQLEAAKGGDARMMSSFLRALLGLVATARIVVAFATVERRPVGAPGAYHPQGNPHSTSNALRFYSSIRVETAWIDERWIEDAIMAKVIKNKFAAPFQTTRM